MRSKQETLTRKREQKEKQELQKQNEKDLHRK